MRFIQERLCMKTAMQKTIILLHLFVNKVHVLCKLRMFVMRMLRVAQRPHHKIASRQRALND
jgi:hypothetical protein